MAVEFIDTNVVIYAFTRDPKATIAQAILAKNCHISVQVLNEFAYVARRKLAMDWSAIDEATRSIEAACHAVHPVDSTIHRAGIRLSEKYDFAFFDALIVAAALKFGASILHSEDMQHGMLIEDRLRISNPFRAIP